MGQPMPLPQRIPNPYGQVKDKMIEYGFELDDDGSDYITYTMPDGWRLVDDSWRADLPCRHFVDAKNIKRITVQGSWKGTYDNELRIYIADNTLYTPRNEEVIPSETDANAMIKKLEDSGNPQLLVAGLQVAMENPDFTGRPQTKRRPDFIQENKVEYTTDIETNKVVFCMKK